MDLLKTLWPIPFKVKEKNPASLIWRLIVFVVVTALLGVLIGVLANLPIIGIIFGIIGSLMGLYNIVGIVLCILKFLAIVK